MEEKDLIEKLNKLKDIKPKNEVFIANLKKKLVNQRSHDVFDKNIASVKHEHKDKKRNWIPILSFGFSFMGLAVCFLIIAFTVNQNINLSKKNSISAVKDSNTTEKEVMINGQKLTAKQYKFDDLFVNATLSNDWQLDNSNYSIVNNELPKFTTSDKSLTYVYIDTETKNKISTQSKLIENNSFTIYSIDKSIAESLSKNSKSKNYVQIFATNNTGILLSSESNIETNYLNDFFGQFQIDSSVKVFKDYFQTFSLNYDSDFKYYEEGDKLTVYGIYSDNAFKAEITLSNENEKDYVKIQNNIYYQEKDKAFYLINKSNNLFLKLTSFSNCSEQEIFTNNTCNQIDIDPILEDIFTNTFINSSFTDLKKDNSKLDNLNINKNSNISFDKNTDSNGDLRINNEVIIEINKISADDVDKFNEILQQYKAPNSTSKQLQLDNNQSVQLNISDIDSTKRNWIELDKSDKKYIITWREDSTRFLFNKNIIDVIKSISVN